MRFTRPRVTSMRLASSISAGCGSTTPYALLPSRSTPARRSKKEKGDRFIFRSLGQLLPLVGAGELRDADRVGFGAQRTAALPRSASAERYVSSPIAKRRALGTPEKSLRSW